jgi:hypothetical protein
MAARAAPEVSAAQKAEPAVRPSYSVTAVLAGLAEQGLMGKLAVPVVTAPPGAGCTEMAGPVALAERAGPASPDKPAETEEPAGPAEPLSSCCSATAV